MDLEILKDRIFLMVSQIENKEWFSCNITYEFAPFINKGFTSIAIFFNVKYEVLDFYMKYDLELNNMLYKFIFLYKSEENNINNQIIFSTTKDDYKSAKIEFGFNQEIEDTFQKNLPKSKKGKTLPWWKIQSEIIGLEII